MPVGMGPTRSDIEAAIRAFGFVVLSRGDALPEGHQFEMHGLSLYVQCEATREDRLKQEAFFAQLGHPPLLSSEEFEKLVPFSYRVGTD
jgi:hypothetical protein